MGFYDDDNSGSDLDIGFDAGTHERSQAKFEALPAGQYQVGISKVEIKPTKDGAMRQAVIELTVTEGPHAGRKVFARHTVATTRTDEGGQKSLAIGRDQLADLFAACGIGGTSLAPLVGKECMAKLSVRPATDQYEASNDVKAYKPLSGAAPLQAAPAASTAAPAPSGKPSFMQRKT